MIPEDIYSQVVRLMPIPCVDLLVEDDQRKVLLVKRANEPGKGKWWFAGGRVLFLETRVQTAVRKLKEECSLEANQMAELGTFDVFVTNSGDSSQLHGITTLFYAKVGKRSTFTLDSQGSEADWRLPQEWLETEGLHSFIKQGLTLFLKHRDKSGK